MKKTLTLAGALISAAALTLTGLCGGARHRH